MKLDGFQENCRDLCESFLPLIKKVNKKVPDMKENDWLEFLFLPSGLILRSSQGGYFETNHPDFSRIILSIWLGNSPPSERLKNNLLGIVNHS